MNGKLLGALAALLASSALSVPTAAAEEKSTTTTQESAEAQQREGRSGSRNRTAAKQLDQLDAEDKADR